MSRIKPFAENGACDFLQQYPAFLLTLICSEVPKTLNPKPETPKDYSLCTSEAPAYKEAF